jgi:hypothetical protein
MKEHFRALITQHLTDPLDPRATVAIAAQQSAFETYFREVFARVDLRELGLPDRVKIFVIVPIWCPSSLKSIFEEWLSWETDAKLICLLRKRVG